LIEIYTGKRGGNGGRREEGTSDSYLMGGPFRGDFWENGFLIWGKAATEQAYNRGRRGKGWGWERPGNQGPEVGGNHTEGTKDSTHGTTFICGNSLPRRGKVLS